MRRALVVGLGVSGRAAVDLLTRKGYEVVGVDNRFGPGVDSTEGFDEVILSPGISPSHPLYSEWAIGEVELGLRYLQGLAVGITGTNGKTTVTLMVAHVLNCCGIPAQAVGNIGTPLCDVAEELGDRVAVLELSSYQLETMRSRRLEAGVVLNIAPDHLDRYEGMGPYAAAKLRLQGLVKGSFWVSQKIANEYRLEGAAIYDVETIVSASYKGVDRLNAQAAYALCRGFGVSPEAFALALVTFTKPPHRLEGIARRGEVAFVNDSKGTNPDAVMAAVGAVEGPVWLIAGGQDKGVSFDPWRQAFCGKVARILLIGEGSGRIREAMRGSIPVEECGTLEQAVKRCQSLTEGTVLLSPGCASFDQFANFEARGDAFRKAVGELT